MPPEVKCVSHNDKNAAGYCSRCQMPYCADCLDVEMGQPLCVVCKRKFSEAGSAVPPETKPSLPSPLNFKDKGLADDPFGLFGSGGPPPKEPPKPAVLSGTGNLKPPIQPSVPPGKATLPSFPSPVTPKAPGAAPVSPKVALDLDSLMNDAPAARPPFPAAPPASAPAAPGKTASLSPVEPFGIPLKKKNKALSLVKLWFKFLARRGYEMFEPLAYRLRMPTYLFILLLVLLVGGIAAGLGFFLNRPTVDMVESIAPLHFIRVNSNQISEMDVTTYGDLQNQLQAMGFTPLLQMTVPQIPSPNFFDVGVKDNIGTYSEILKLPGQITPHLSFVTVFTNGIWFSTNGWPGDNKTMEFLMSEFYPKDTPDQLYIKHVQALEKIRQEKGWQVQSLNENRYLAALSDHLRWFLEKKDLQGYKADFGLWH